MTLTDFIVLVLSIFLLARGAARGFIRSLLAPASLIITTILSILYYQETHDLVVSLLLGLLGPILLHLLLKFLLKTFAKATNTDVSPGFFSSLAGGVLTLAWGWVFIALTLILLALFPVKEKPLTTLHKDLTDSIAYKTTAPWVGTFIPVAQEKSADNTHLSSTSDAQSLAQDPRFQKVLQDAEIQQEITNHDMGKLLSNPKIMALTQQIMTDPEMLKKVMAVWQSQQKSPSP